MKLTLRIATLVVCLGLLISIPTHARAKSKGAGYAQTNLISDIPGLAEFTDPTLLNPWGVAFFPGQSPFWINENGSGFSALDFADGAPFPALPRVIIPPAAAPGTGTPTGIVANFFVASGAFPIVIAGTNFGPSLFIFATEDGTIQAWNINPPTPPGIPNPLTAVVVVDNSPSAAVYKGLALGANAANGPLLYATNFRTGKVDVFDTNFQSPTPPLRGSFTDPKLQAGYAPFGIQNINGQIWVTFAKQDAAKHDDVSKPGHGFVDVFDTDGNLLTRFAQHGHLDSPWGLTMAPATFGQFAGDILIGNFGDGVINAYDPQSGKWLGSVTGSNGRPLVNDGLWALTFGGALNSDGTASSPGTLFFSAGLNDEADGLFGSIVPQ